MYVAIQKSKVYSCFTYKNKGKNKSGYENVKLL